MTRSEMIQELVTEQNRIACAGVPIDIMTFAGFLDDEELAKHLLHYAAYVPEPRPTRRSHLAA